MVFDRRHLDVFRRGRHSEVFNKRALMVGLDVFIGNLQKSLDEDLQRFLVEDLLSFKWKPLEFFCRTPLEVSLEFRDLQ